MTRTLDEVLELAASNDWSDRRLAAEHVGRFTDARADAALAGLLDDPEDTAVCVAAAHAVLRRDDAASAEVLLRFLAAGDEDCVSHVVDELTAAWEAIARSGLRARTVAAFTADDPVLVAGARELLDVMGWWDGPPPPPPPPPATIDGWNVRLTADVREPVATCDGLHYVRDGYVSGVRNLVLAAHPEEPGVALLWCDHHWNALATTRYFDADLALAQAAFHFGPVPFRDPGGEGPKDPGAPSPRLVPSAPVVRATALRIEAAVTFLTAAEGGRRTPVSSGYRPDAWFGQRTDTGLETCWGFRFDFPGLDDDAPVPVAQEVIAHMQAATAGFGDLPVRVGDLFEVREGSMVAARGRVLRVLDA